MSEFNLNHTYVRFLIEIIITESSLDQFLLTSIMLTMLFKW